MIIFIKIKIKMFEINFNKYDNKFCESTIYSTTLLKIVKCTQ